MIRPPLRRIRLRGRPGERPSGRPGEVGATSVEYGLLLALLAGVIIGTVRVLGDAVTAIFDAAVRAF